MKRLRKSLTRSQVIGWKAYERVRGPLGPQRFDRYFALLAMACSPGGIRFGKKDSAGEADFLALLPWIRPGDVAHLNRPDGSVGVDESWTDEDEAALARAGG